MGICRVRYTEAECAYVTGDLICLICLIYLFYLSCLIYQFYLFYRFYLLYLKMSTLVFCALRSSPSLIPRQLDSGPGPHHSRLLSSMVHDVQGGREENATCGRRVQVYGADDQSGVWSSQSARIHHNRPKIYSNKGSEINHNPPQPTK
jgi:hypothetical protein